MTHRLFALERYDRSDAGAPPEPVPTLASTGVRLIGAVHLPDDGVVLALVEGPDVATVTAAATAVGWRIDRLSPASWVTPQEFPPPPSTGGRP